MSAPPNLISLPTELLDRFYAYLDWSRFDDLVPYRPNITRLSLTCRHIRATIVPHLFRNVTLCLRWQDGILLEPGLYQLRRQCPHLARHIRCVYVVTRMGYRPGTQANEIVRGFEAPRELEDWLDLGEAGGSNEKHHGEMLRLHREKVQVAVNELYESLREDEKAAREAQDMAAQPQGSVYGSAPAASYSALGTGLVHDDLEMADALSAEMQITELQDILRSKMRHAVPPRSSHTRLELWEEPMNYVTALGSDGVSTSDFIDRSGSIPVAQRSIRRLKLRTDALAALMMCLPVTVNEVVIESGTQGLENKAWYYFALYFINYTFQILGHRLDSITMATSAPNRSLSRSRHQQTTDVADITPAAVGSLTSLKSLILASTSATPENFNIHHSQVSDPTTHWASPTLRATVTSFELWNTKLSDAQLTTLVEFLKFFQALRQVRFKNIAYATRGMPSYLFPNNPAVPDIGAAVWLQFCISLRRVLPSGAPIQMENVAYSTGGRFSVPVSALTWIMKEAVPAGGDGVDHQREERLHEDFESFLPLWEAEDSERGRLAEVERKGGELVDVAMCNRWRQFENVRRDRGEWETL